MEEKKVKGGNSFWSFFGLRHSIHPILRRKIAGFTLIELLVVMGVVSILAATTLTAVNPNDQLKKARDVQRKTDLKSVQKELEAYYVENIRYPQETDGKVDGVNWGEPWEPYLHRIPKDPLSPEQNYLYESDENGTYYRLFAKLERCNDEMILPDVDCETAEYNFSLVSAGIIAEGLPTSTPSPTPPDGPTPSPIPFDCPTNPLAGSSQTTVGTLTLVPTYESISIYANFSGDTEGNNNACFRYRKVGESTWITGMELTPDRRSQVFAWDRLLNNPFNNQWRGSVLNADPGTDYEIEVVFTDPNGFVGEIDSRVASTTTRTETALIPSNGRSLYVSLSGSDSTGDGSDSDPWRTIQKAAAEVLSGDTVFVKAGEYTEEVTITRSGSSSNYITFRNFGNDEVVINPPGDNASRGTRAIDVNASYIRIKGFKIRDTNKGIAVASNSTFVIVEDNIIEDFGSAAESGIGIEIGGLVGSTSFTPDSNVANITVQNNTIRYTIRPASNDRAAIDSSARNLGGHVIRNNNIEFFYQRDSTHGEDCFASTPNSLDGDINKHGWKDTDIYNNICIGATDDSIELDGTNINTRVWGNIMTKTNLFAISIAGSYIGPTYVFRNLAYDWELVPGEPTSVCKGIKEGRGGSGFVYFFHNTFYMPQSECGNTNFIVMDSGGGNPVSNIVMKNNLFYFNDRVIRSASGVYEADYNLVYDQNGGTVAFYNNTSYSWSAWQGIGKELNGINQQPSFVNAGGGNFNLSPGSPGVDKGLVMPGFNDAYSGWPANGAPDMGAYEQ